MERVREILASELEPEVVERLAARIEAESEVRAKEPAPDRVFETGGWSCEVRKIDGMQQIRASSGTGRVLQMNVEGHWSDQEVEVYAAEQIGLHEAMVRARRTRVTR